MSFLRSVDGDIVPKVNQVSDLLGVTRARLAELRQQYAQLKAEPDAGDELLELAMEIAMTSARHATLVEVLDLLTD